MNDMTELLAQARKMQEQMKIAQEESAKRTVVGESGAGLVKVELGGRYDVRRLQLSDDLMSEDKTMIEDLIAAAFNDAVKKLDDGSRDTFSQMASGFKMPDGFKFPF